MPKNCTECENLIKTYCMLAGKNVPVWLIGTDTVPFFCPIMLSKRRGGYKLEK